MRMTCMVPRPLTAPAVRRAMATFRSRSVSDTRRGPDTPVVSISGDGGFLFTAMEMATAAQHGIGVVAVVFSDGAYGNVKRIQQQAFNNRTIASDLHNPDFVKLAESFGIAGFRCDTPEEVDAAIVAALECGGPAVIEARVDREEKVYPMVPAGAPSAEMLDVEWAEDDNQWVEEGV